MALINLHALSRLALGAFSDYYQLKKYCLTPEEVSKPLPDKLVASIMKTHLQAQNLYHRLRNLYRVCSDFASGNFESYIDEHNKWEAIEADEDRIPFDPFVEFEVCLTAMAPDSLPVQIEQYKELLEFSRHFAEQQSLKRSGHHPFLGYLSQAYDVRDTMGRLAIVPEEELPPRLRRQIVTEEEYMDIEVEHCLDSYNQFYVQIRSLIDAHSGGDAQACATAILSHISPFNASYYVMDEE